MNAVKSAPKTAVVARDVHGRTLYEVMVRSGSAPRRARQVLAFMVQWQIVINAHDGGDITLQDYADYWQEPISTAFRTQQWFRQALPKAGPTPTGVLAICAQIGWTPEAGVGGLGAATPAL